MQDFALDDGTIEEIRADESVRTDVVAVVGDLAAGSWKVTPYDTWQGTWLPTLEVDCPGGACELSLPDFHSDLAIHLEG